METEALATETVALDRRQRRRLETIEEVLDVAAEVMVEQGVAGLSVGEVARRMGIRPPSLYVYFDSKNALYDALFERGARLVLAHVQTFQQQADESQSLEDALLSAADTFCRWAVGHPAYTQLLFWRPVPGFTPSERAYEPAVALVELSRERFADLQRRRLIRDDVPVDQVQRDWTILQSGVVSQQLANAPDEPFESGTFTGALPDLVAMFARHYAPTSPPSTPRRRARHADQR
jgi:AcrR family transcriptional regulator